jgi:hypothetical protein
LRFSPLRLITRSAMQEDHAIVGLALGITLGAIFWIIGYVRDARDPLKDIVEDDLEIVPAPYRETSHEYRIGDPDATAPYAMSCDKKEQP